MMDRKKYVIIVAGGKGLRMGGEVPKQFQMIAGRPILMRTIERFLAWNNNVRIVLVLPESQRGYWESLCCEYSFAAPCVVCNGGSTRFESVSNGLASITDDDALVAVHDGVRPFVSADVIERCFDSADVYGCAVPVVPVVESVRSELPDGTNCMIPRDNLRLVQTPQVFRMDILRKSYSQPYTPDFTDDASVVENAGYTVALVPGNRENIKLTSPFDLMVAEALIKNV